MEILNGRSTFPGIAIGRIFYHFHRGYKGRTLATGNVKREQELFDKARMQVLDSLRRDEESRHIADLLNGKTYSLAVRSLIEEQKVTASYACTLTRDEMLYTFQKLSDPVMVKRLVAVREATARLLSALGAMPVRIKMGDEKAILVSETLTPREIAELEKDKILAVVTRQGSDISHTAILAKTMDVPSLFDIGVREDWDGRMAIVDGYGEKLILDPDKETTREYEERQKEDLKNRHELLSLRDKEDITKDGRRVGVWANIGSMTDVAGALAYGAAGIGLLRSEFQFLGKEACPSESQLFYEYREMLQEMKGKLCIIRVVDLGGEKEAEYLDFPEEANPLMGNRGVRYLLDHEELFLTQLRAILRASAFGQTAVMFPMVTSLKEIALIEEVLDKARDDLKKDGIPYENIKKGYMVETPAAVMMAEEIASHADFLSIGTNDLSQFALAMDRQNLLVKNKYNVHHPAVLRMVRMTIEAGHRKNCPVYICGELAADTSLTEEFIRMGVDGFSVVPACILPVRRAIRNSYYSRPSRKRQGLLPTFGISP